MSLVEEAEQVITGSAIPHPRFPSTRVANDPFDIALIELVREAEFNPNVRAMPLAPSWFQDPPNATVRLGTKSATYITRRTH